MKKIILLLVFCLCFGITHAQRSDTLLRAVGFYISPGITNQYLTNSNSHNKTKFGGSMGYRITNKLSHGFFIEGGVGIGYFNYESPEYESYWSEYGYADPYYHSVRYTYKKSTKEINWTVPFLAGYKTPKGKVRFQGALGLSFNVKIFEESGKTITGGIGPINDYEYRGDNHPSFGTSFFAIGRAGISIPVKNRLNIEILPTARYRMFYFTSDRMDLAQSIQSKERPWSLGLDIGLMISLDDKERELEYEKDAGNDYTYKAVDDAKEKPAKKKLLNNGPKNAAYIEFGGNGIIYSFNYERTVFRKGIVNLQVRGGFGCTFQKYSIPLGANIALGTTRKKFEAGLTVTMNNFNRTSYGDIYSGDLHYNDFNVSIDPSIAFRLESNTHLFLRLALMTHYFPVTGGIMPGVGVSLGGCF
jgi:hypothetical protein